MTSRITIHDIAVHFGLHVEVSHDLPSDFAGCLAPARDPSLILINGNRPELEQRFTIAHEIAHYVLHPKGQSRTMARWPLRQQWRWYPMKLWSRAVRRWAHRKITCEQEADTYAMLLLFRIGDPAPVRHYVTANPKQQGWLLLACLVGFFRRATRAESQHPFEPIGYI